MRLCVGVMSLYCLGWLSLVIVKLSYVAVVLFITISVDTMSPSPFTKTISVTFYSLPSPTTSTITSLFII